ncbi:hypothetical protein BD560DRAFT_242463 [Blakeslea trispora]|nr:hypothetical protein BD560DRAFT_242463 [Blakeslea trispora]
MKGDSFRLADLIYNLLIHTSNITVYNTFLLTLNYAFLIDDAGAISLQEARGEAISSILPTSGSSSNQEFLPPPLAPNCVGSRVFEKLYKSIFDQSHLQIIHSAYFGPKGTRKDTSNKNPIIKAFVDAMPPREDEKCTVDNYLMKKAYSMYFVNFKNMWTRPGRFRKTLNQLLSHSLRIHIAPERTKQYKHYLSQSKQDRQKIKKTQNHVYLPAIPFSSISLINNSRSHRWNLFKK